MKQTLFLVTSLLVGVCQGQDISAGCKRLDSETLGNNLGSVFLEFAGAFADAGLWADADCDSPKSREERNVCSLVRDIESAGRKINKAIDRGCIKEDGPFLESPDFHAFAILQEGLSSINPRLRWQVLFRIYQLCRQGFMLTDAGSSGCNSVVEEASLKLLEEDLEPFNRHLALEILGQGYASSVSESALRELTQTPPQSDTVCPHGLRSRANPTSLPTSWESISAGYERSEYSCEFQFANEILQTLADSGSESSGSGGEAERR